MSNQKEQIGGLNVKKSTISGDRFKKGTSLDKRVGINEKKITLLKNIGSLRKDNQKKQFNSPLLESLQSIASTVGSIRDTLIQQQDNDKGIAEDMRREKEEKERKDQEKGLEAPKPLQKIADKVIAPVMSLWSKILKFITTIFLGKILMNFLDWFGNPENQGKITTLVRFVKDWWPALVGAVLLFGTGFGGLVTGLTVAIATFIPKMLAAITALKASKLGALGGKAGLLKGGLLVGGGVLAGMGISKMMDKGDGEDVSNEKVQGLNKGGKVRGQGNKDTVPAMLTPGEFVMSKGAVEQYGVDTMESMNAAAGGTNRPTMGRYNTGGTVQNISNSSFNNVGNGGGMSFGGPKIHYSGGGMVNSIRSGTTINVPQTIIPKQPLRFAGGGVVPEAKIVKSSPSTIVINPPSSSSLSSVVEDDPVAQVNTRLGARSAPSQELPEFSATSMRSISKIKTLGIMV